MGGAGTGGAGTGGAGAGGAGGGGAGAGGAGAGGAGAGGSGGAAYAGCTTFDDRTAGGNMTRLVRAGIGGNLYAPKCMRVRVGQTVTIEASTTHPLSPAAQTGNPITAGTTNQTFQPATAGIYGYYCMIHGTPDGSGMAGALEVVP
jgi:plastocyanin